MDTLDVRVLHAILRTGPGVSLDRGFRRSFSDIARDLGVDESTVANRVRRLRLSGFLKGWALAINPRLIGEKMIQLWVDVNGATAKPEAIAKIRLLPGVAVVKDLYGPTVGLVVYYEGETALQRMIRLLSQIAGSGAVSSMPEPFPECDLVLTEQDLRILRALHREPLTSYTRLAKSLGRSAKTIKRRIARLCDGEAIYLVAELDPKFLSGGIVGSLLVSCSSSAEKQTIDRKILHLVGDQLMFASLDAPQHSHFALIVTGVSQSRDILAAVLKIPGVVARLDLVAEVFSEYGVYEDQLNRLTRSPNFRSARSHVALAS